MTFRLHVNTAVGFLPVISVVYIDYSVLSRVWAKIKWRKLHIGLVLNGPYFGEIVPLEGDDNP